MHRVTITVSNLNRDQDETDNFDILKLWRHWISREPHVNTLWLIQRDYCPEQSKPSRLFKISNTFGSSAEPHRKKKHVKSLVRTVETLLTCQSLWTWSRDLHANLKSFFSQQDLVKTTLDFDSLSNDNVYVVRAAFDDNLLKTKAEMDSLKSSIEDSATKMASTLGLDKKALKLDW